jgi:deoxyribonuclease-4
MLVGAHVSPAGGLANAIERGVERDCDAIQIFNQSPRAWRPNRHEPEAIAAFGEARDASRVDAVLIHAVYLMNCASEDPVILDKTRTALIDALRLGDQIRADAVILHAGSAKTGDLDAAIARAGGVIAEALAESESTPLHLEDTAGGGATLGRSFGELGRLIEAAGGGPRLGVCLDSCHLYASGYDVRTAAGLASVVDDLDSELGIDRLRSLHVNDSVGGLGSNRDRHAYLGAGELGREGIAAFLSEPRFEGLPCVLEGPGIGGKAAQAQDVALARELRAEGLAARAK